MILICTPTVRAEAGFTEQVVTFLCAAGFTERMPVAIEAAGGLTLATAQETVSVSGGFNEFVTDQAVAVEVRGGVTEALTPTVSARGGVLQVVNSIPFALPVDLSVRRPEWGVKVAPVFAAPLGLSLRRPALRVRVLPDSVGGLVLTLRRPTMSLGLNAPVADTFSAWVMTPQGKHARYDNFPFTGFAKMGSTYLACAADGIYALDAETDNGEMIHASLKSAIVDCGSPLRQRLRDLYFTARSAGDLKVTLTHDEERRQEQTIPGAGGHVLRQHRARAGRSSEMDFNVVQIEITNPDGGDFEVLQADFTTDPSRSRRR